MYHDNFLETFMYVFMKKNRMGKDYCRAWQSSARNSGKCSLPHAGASPEKRQNTG
jgi:hypothetical protein